MNRLSKVELGDLVEFQRGYDLPKSLFKHGNIPVISSNGILGYHNEIKAKAPGITIGRSGTVGLPHYIDTDFYPHNTALFVRDFKGNNPKYIYYLIKTLRLNEFKSGSGVPTMNRNHLHPLKISAYLNHTEQEKIAAVLSALDDKIELNNRINTELEQMAKTLYDYWFVQFDFPDANGKPYKSSGGKMVYNDVLKREIPEGWEVKPLSEINSELVRGISPKYSEDAGMPVINQRCIRNQSIDYSLCRLHNVTIKPVKKLVQVGDVLVNSTGVGTLGRVAIIKWLPDPQTTVDSHVTIVRADHTQVDPTFLGFSLQNKQLEIETLGEGSTGQTELSRVNLGKLNILLPKRELQKVFSSMIKPIFEKVAISEQQNQELAALRDWLLPMLMNGQATVGNVAQEYKTKQEDPQLAAEDSTQYKTPKQAKK